MTAVFSRGLRQNGLSCHDFIDKKETWFAGGNGVPSGDGLFGHGVHLDVAHRLRGKVVAIGQDAIGILFAHGQIVLPDNGSEVLAIGREAHHDTAWPINPVGLFDKGIEGHAAHRRGPTEVDDSFEIFGAEAQPASGLEVEVGALQTVDQYGGAGKLISVVDALKKPDVFGRGEGEVEIFLLHLAALDHRTAAGARTTEVAESGGTQLGIFLKDDGRFVERAGRCGGAAVEGVADVGIVKRGEGSHNTPLGIELIGSGDVVEVLCKIVVLLAVEVEQTGQTLDEFGEILRVARCPLDFSKRSHTRQLHVFDLLEVGNVLRPKVGLYTDDVAGFFGSGLFRYGFVTINRGEGEVSSDSHRLLLRIFGLIVVKVEVGVGSHDGIVAAACRFETTGFTAPRHNGGTGSQSAFERFVPTDDFAAAARKVLLGMTDNIAL